jgi:DNA repair protein RecO (recombination protein O)
MICTTEGIVLKQFPYSESSIICKIFTRDFGLLSFIIRGAKSSKKSGQGSFIRPMNRIAFSFYNKENKNLKSIVECNLLFAPDAKNFGIYKSSVAMMIVEVLNNTITEESQVDFEKYEFIDKSFEYLIQHELVNHFYLSFLYQYANHLGFALHNDQLDSYATILSDYHFQTDAISKKERKQLFEKLEAHYFENIQNFKSIKSIHILEEILQ